MIKGANIQVSQSTMATGDTTTTQINHFCSYIKMLMDPDRQDVSKLIAMREISENFEMILASSLYPKFLELAIPTFIKILQEGEPHFIAEYNIQQVRKLILEILHRFPTNNLLKQYTKNMLTLMFKLLKTENEENVLVCLKIIIELHKQYRPNFNQNEIHDFLDFVKSIYSKLSEHIDKIFAPREPIRVSDLSKLNIEELLKETFTTTTIQVKSEGNDEVTITDYNLIPKAVLSLKVLQELPIIVVLMYQLYKQNVYQDVSEFIPLVMETITLQPSLEQRSSEKFNKEIFVDFMGAQIKTLSFLAYIIKHYQKVVEKYSSKMIEGMLGLLALCPMEVAHLRRELLIAARHILATDLRNDFVPKMEQLFNEDVLLGRGWTTHESLRPLAYSTLADLVHHVRHELPFSDLTRAVHLFSKNVHDDTLATTIQIMSCKLLLSLVECIRSKAENANEGRELLMRMLEVVVLKFKTIAKIQLPILMSKCKPQQNATATNEVKTEPGQKPEGVLETAVATTAQNSAQKDDKSKFGLSQNNNYNVADYRILVKTLVCVVKTINWGCTVCKQTATQPVVMRQCQPHEILVFVRLLKWALKALDIYTLNVGPQPGAPPRLNQQTVRTKDEKEALEYFSGVFIMMNPQTFHEIFSTTIEYVVERIYKNPTLQIIANSLLGNPKTSPIFATVLVEYLLERMEEMGSNVERSNLYLRLFKLVFGFVSVFPQENENMLRQYLHQIVNRSMELAMSAKEPYNYFLLLRALFRSIGGGKHDLLYQEFLPLLPNLLEGLNRLQSGLHKQHMKDLFVELCLTVPVRLSSLLPYLPMLMDPLVSALNGSHVLISQGLRTLELCVDNLQHDFLYEHIQPVRADLMQALWRTLRNNDQVAHVAFKVLGKFGGGNRKMMIEPQKLEYITTDQEMPAIIAHFQDQQQSIEFPVQKVIETAFNTLKQSSTDSFYRKQAWEAINCYLIASISLDDDSNLLKSLFTHGNYQDPRAIPHEKGSSYTSTYKQARETHQTALTGMIFANAIKELNASVWPTMMSVVCHYTMVAVVQQAGTFAVPRPNEQIALDPLVLVDALAVIMGHEEKELCKHGHAALTLIIKTATALLGSKEMACRLPLIEYLSEKMCALCYERAWYAKLGGCIAIKFMFENCAQKWVYEHMFTFLKALLFVMMDLTGEVSSGALDMAKNNLEKMLVVLVTPPDTVDKATLDARAQALHEVTYELVRSVTSTHTMVREQSMHSLRLLAEKQNKTVTAVMEPFKKVLEDMVPPTKYLLKHQPAIAQIGLMDGNTFCTTLNPRLFTIDRSIKEHKCFTDDLLLICNMEDAKLNNYSCYKNITNFIPLRISALKVLAACHYLEPDVRSEIFQVLYNALEKPNPELQKTAFECMKQFISGYQVEKQLLDSNLKPFLENLGDARNLTLSKVKMLLYLTQLFPLNFKESLCEHLLIILKKMLENLVKIHKTSMGVSKKGEEEQKIVTILGVYHQTPTASSKLIPSLCDLVLKTEQIMLIEASSPFREVLMKFLLRYPAETVDMFLDDNYVKDLQYGRYFEYLVKHKDGKPFRDYIQNKRVDRLIEMVKMNTDMTSPIGKHELYQSIRIVSILIKFDDPWLSSQKVLVDVYKQVWCNNSYQERHKNIETLEYTHWKEPKLLVKILLHYFCKHPDDIDLLFQLLRAMCDRFIPDFTFLQDFLENIVAQNYIVEWKRSAFFRFIEHFQNGNKMVMSDELTAKVIQLILIPCFTMSFQKEETNKLIIGASGNIVSVFINKLMDPEKPFKLADCVRIALLQFSCLLVEKASPYFHDNNKGQGFKLRKLMTFAWPCLLGKNCVDPATRYHGHLLLSHIIDKFAIHHKIVLQVFHSLLKAHAVEARNVVRQALEILTPSIPLRMEEGSTLLIHWTKKIIVEEGHSMQQLVHILQLVVRHYKVYYPVRHQLVQHMVNSIQRLGFSPTATLEHRKLAVELAEVIIKWELFGIKEDMDSAAATEAASAPDDAGEPARKRQAIQGASSSMPLANIEMGGLKSEQDGAVPGTSTGQTGSGGVSWGGNVEQAVAVVKKDKRIDKVHTDTVLNFLLRLACKVNDPAPQNPANPMASSPGELLSRRCVILLKTALKPDVWPEPVDLKLEFFDDILLGVVTPNPNVANICTALELLTFLLTVMDERRILDNFKNLQKGLEACINSSNSKVIRLIHLLLTKLMALFPTERTNLNMSCKYEELVPLYSTVDKVIQEGLKNENNFPPTISTDKNIPAGVSNQRNYPSGLFSTLMILKAACINNSSYIDLQIISFIRVLHKIAKEHLRPAIPESSPMTSELLILSLDLVKTRVVVMSLEMRKSFIGQILVGLIEKTPDIKVMKAITKMLEEWMRNKNEKTLSQAPSLREKSILLVKMMQYVEKRFPDDTDLNAQFLELVNFVYTDEQLIRSELTSKLEPAFLSGLRCSQPHIRAKFFKVFDESMRRRLHDRLLYITCSQNWEAIGPHYWIKQCIELLLVTAQSNTPIQMSHESAIIPSITSVINSGDLKTKKELGIIQMNSAMSDIKIKEEEMELDLIAVDSNSTIEESPKNREETIAMLITKHREFAEAAKNVTTEQFLMATAQLCHMDTSLAEHVWLNLFPRLWSIFDEQQRNSLIQEILPFIASGTHILQRDCNPSAINTFVEALSRCNPPIQIAPPTMKNLGKSHNLWHRMALNLEQMAFDPATTLKPVNPYDFEPDQTPKNEVLDSLQELYSLLCEEDLWAGLWQKHAHYKETSIAIAYEQHGFFEQAQSAYESAMAKYKQDNLVGSVPSHTQREVLLWTYHWIRCAKELNQWVVLLEYAKNGVYDPYLMLESSWRIPAWDIMKQALSDVECSKELAWKITMYGGYLLICNPEDKQLTFNEGYVENATTLCLMEWRRLPHIVSHIHLPYLQAAQQIIELQEAYQIHKDLKLENPDSLHDMKAIVKTWRNRLPVIADDLTHWNDIFTWRQHHYQFIVSQCERNKEITQAKSMVGVHASAQSIIHFGKIARKHKLTNVSLETLNRIHTIPSVPVIDCFQTVRQKIKCYLQLASMNNKNELQSGLKMIDSTELSIFNNKEMTAEIYALKGLLYHLSSQSDEANIAFSIAVQIHDTSVKAWALYGDYLEQVFIRDPRQISLGVNAMTCFLHACRHQNESKARKYLAKVLWLLSYDDENSSLMKALDKYSAGVPPVLWLPWTPQLLNCMVQYEGDVILNLLCQVGRMFPQAVFFPVRILYLTLKTQKTTTVQQQSQDSQAEGTNQSQDNTSTTTASTGTESAIKAPPQMVRASKVIKVLQDILPTVLLSLEGIADQMEWFREHWYEVVVRQLRQGLAKCYAIAFENRDSVMEAKITPHILNFINKVLSTFGIGVENNSISASTTFDSAASESLARTAEATYQDPVFKEIKQEFAKDFNFSNSNTMRLHTLIYKLKKWIKILENRFKMLIQSFLIEEKCRYLSSFTLKTAELELPGEFLLPKHTHYYVRINRFMPRVDIVQKYNTAARRLYIRGHNGKIYPYLLVNDSGLVDARREERVLQLLRMLNHYLGKQKETARRFLHFMVPRVVAVSLQKRLVEDNPASISLLDIFKKGCKKLAIEHDAPIHYYYERLAAVQTRGIKASHQVYRDILKGVQTMMVPKKVLKNWALTTFPSATDYWQFRKMFTLQLALACFAEYVLHLTRLNPDMMYLHQDSGLMNVSYFKFDVDDSTGELVTTRPVHFRLTPNIIEYLSSVGINGPLTASMIATARCLVYPNFKVPAILKPILRDEMILSRKKKLEDSDGQNQEKLMDSEQLINMVNKAVTSIVNRLNSLAHFDGLDSKVGTLVAAASNHDNLCRMDPAWHPWL